MFDSGYAYLVRGMLLRKIHRTVMHGQNLYSKVDQVDISHDVVRYTVDMSDRFSQFVDFGSLG